MYQQPTGPTNQSSLFMSRDWLSANQGPVYPDSFCKLLCKKTSLSYTHSLTTTLLEFLVWILMKINREWISAGRKIKLSNIMCPDFPNTGCPIYFVSELPNMTFESGTGRTNQNSLFRSRDWLTANQGPVFPDSVLQLPSNRRLLLQRAKELREGNGNK